ncbi:alpha-2-macroglobulin [Patella vulgata]|uniref:alpha-2-macroglobulin n=1 Tax=Patella vulgata TaxID=6465 RepID=UPI0024A7EBD1|nr:alpha-2-macroglobulin [Patella vulgata]
MESGTVFRLLLLVPVFLCLMNVANSGYVVTMPKDIQIGRETSVCFTFHNSKEYMKINLRFSNLNGTYMLERGTIGYARAKCFEFTIPTTQSPGRHKIAITGDNSGKVIIDGELTFDVTDPILTFIQTDKPVYKPGQTVNFRVLVINTDLKQTNKSVSSILIKDPDGVIMKQWLDIRSLSGLISLEFQLSKEPVLGSWKIVTSVGSTVKTTPFTIEEYVLPKFELTISPPPYITIESETIEGEVCAMYTYGQPVKGRLKMTACVVTATYISPYSKKRPCIYFYSEIDGCHQFSVNTSQLQLKMKQFILDDSLIDMTASVLDNATDIVISKSTNKTIISLMDLFLDIKTQSEPFYKPGLPYHIKVKATDLNGKPAIGRTLAIRAEELGFDKEIVTDDKGYGIYTFPAMTSNATEIVLKVIGVDIRYSKGIFNEYSLITPGASLVIEPWYSSTRSYLKITPPEKPAKCNSTVTLEVSMTQAPEKSFRLYLMVLSRGQIVRLTSKGISKRSRFEGGCQQHNQFELIDCIVRRKLYNIRYSDVKVESMLIDVKVDKDMAPSAQIIMYYVHDYGEVVSDVVELTVTDCDSQTVNLEFGTDKEYPGYETTLTLQAEPGSVCGIGVIDKSVLLLGQVNTITQSQLLKASDIYKVDLFDPLNENYPTHKDHCKKWLSENEPPRRIIKTFSDKTLPKSAAELAQMEKVSIISNGWYPDDEDDYYYRVEHTDASQAFKTAGVVYLTDLKLDNRPCKEVWKKSYLSADDSFSGDDSFEAPSVSPAKPDKKKQVAVRDFFPETWLWDLEIVGETGKLVMKKELPHTITKWLGNAVCSHKEKGVRISNDAAITTFQPFFTSFNLPYSAIRGEFIPIKVTTFNYFSECVQIRLELKGSEFIDIDPDVGSVTSLCICSNEAKSYNFIIVPKKIGEVNLTVVAESVAGDSRCSGFDISAETVGVQDTVIRPLLVEPEGTEKEYTYGTLVCPEEYNNGQYRSVVDLPIPRDHVPDSARGFVSVIGDLMGPSLNSATDLLRLPYGCGEQNMINFAPNIYVMKYTKSTGQMDSIDSDSIKKFLIAGYQRELRYKRSDHSFSAFGQSDGDGSTWLTVFVAKCFHQASEFIFVDKLIISRALDWATIQYHRGSFRSRGRVIHGDMKGGIQDGSTDVLSAYILTVMLETGYYDKTHPKVVKAVNYLQSKVPPEKTYAVAVYNYVAALYEPGGSWHKLLVKELESRATVKDNMMFWKAKPEPERSTHNRNTQYKRASALDIETTSYALLAYQSDPNPQFTKMLRIVRWLTEQQNPNGGFMSTQVSLFSRRDTSFIIFGPGTSP